MIWKIDNQGLYREMFAKIQSDFLFSRIDKFCLFLFKQIHLKL